MSRHASSVPIQAQPRKLACGEFSSHRFKAFDTNAPVDNCVRCGKLHADVARARKQMSSETKRHTAKPKVSRARVQIRYGVCSVCGRIKPVNADGFLWSHGPDFKCLNANYCGNFVKRTYATKAEAEAAVYGA